jgi:hypothetical protein
MYMYTGVDRAYLGTDELDGRTGGDKQLDQEHVLAGVSQGQQERLAGLRGLCSARETKRKRLRLEVVDWDLQTIASGPEDGSHCLMVRCFAAQVGVRARM